MVATGLASLTAVAPTKSNDPLAWMDRAACAGMADKGDFRKNGDPFYPSSAAPEAAREGKRICATCPVLAECYAHSLDASSSRQYGTFGGLSEEERRTRQRLKQRAEANERRRKAKTA